MNATLGRNNDERERRERREGVREREERGAGERETISFKKKKSKLFRD